jgi:hypothetical protein
LLAGDQPGTGRNTGHPGLPDAPRSPIDCRFPADRQQAGLLRPPAESKAMPQPLIVTPPRAGTIDEYRFCPEGVGALLAGDRPGTGRNTRHPGLPDAPRSPGLLPVPGRSSASWTPTASGQNQRQSPKSSATTAERGNERKPKDWNAFPWRSCRAARRIPLLPGGRRSLACRRSTGHRSQHGTLRFN